MPDIPAPYDSIAISSLVSVVIWLGKRYVAMLDDRAREHREAALYERTRREELEQLLREHSA